MRTPFIAGNWKMHKTVSEARVLASALAEQTEGSTSRIMVAPPFTALATVVDALAGSPIMVGAQNMGPAESGAHTGEIAPGMLKDLGVDIVILGHSERRHSYGERDELINTKVTLALASGLEVIFCVGETLEEREKGITETLVSGQVKAGLASVGESVMGSVTIAYEPVWAIGTGKTATPDDAEAIHRVIRDTVADLYSSETAEKVIIQYGGSVKPDNVKALMTMADIDGALVGGASLSAETFVPIIRFDRD